jgi:hypothetical protein
MKYKFLIGILIGVIISILGVYVFFKEIPCITIEKINLNQLSGFIDDKCLKNIKNDENEIWLLVKNNYGYFCQDNLYITDNSWSCSISINYQEQWRVIFVSVNKNYKDTLIYWKEKSYQLGKKDIEKISIENLIDRPLNEDTRVEVLARILKPIDQYLSIIGSILTMISFYFEIRKRKKKKELKK